MGVGGQRHAPAALLLEKRPYRRLVGPQCRSGRVRKISSPRDSIPGPLSPSDLTFLTASMNENGDANLMFVCFRELRYSSPVTGLEWPRGFQEVKVPRFFMTTAQGGGKVVSLTHQPHLPPGNSPGTHFCLRLSRPQGHSAIGRIMSMKNSNDTIWNRTSGLPICSTAP